MTWTCLKTIAIATLALLIAAPGLRCQTADQWRQDIDTLVGLIERHHPKPWARISRQDFLERADDIKAKLPLWPFENITVEVMKLAASLYDGHTEVLLNGQARFNLWFPVRMERFYDGIFITACDASHPELLGSRVLRLGRLAASDAYEKVAAITAKDSEASASRLTSNYLSNAVVLKALDIIEDQKELQLEVVTAGNDPIKIALASDAWAMRNNWTWNLTAVPTGKKTFTIFDGRLDELPPYLSKMVPVRIPYWFELFPEKKLLFLQLNAITNWDKDPFADFMKRLFKSYDDKAGGIDKFVIDLRFNEGGNGYLLPPFLQEFIVRRDSLPRGKLFVITGRRTFSAATNLIGNMLKHTRAVTVGDIAPGPLNWCSDTLDFRLPNSHLFVQISSMFWMTGHAIDTRGCYPPDYYLPETFKDLGSFTDRPLDAILAGAATPLKDILLDQGWTAFQAELDRRKARYPDVERWFPYTHFDQVMTAYFNLLPSGKKKEALELLKLNAALFPRELWSWYGLAEVAKSLDETDLAIEAYEMLMKMEPQIADAAPAHRSLLLLQSFRDGGVKGLAAKFQKMKAAEPGDINEDTLNALGYDLLQKGEARDAVSVFTLNVEMFPEYANGFDSLGDAWLKIGDAKEARRAYEKALKLDPGLSSSKKALEELGKR
jgi:tetratricopeptide (TPR) repeat protein